MKDDYAAGSIWWWRRDFGDGRGPVKKYFVFLTDCTVTEPGLLAMTTSRGRRYHGQNASPCGYPTNPCFRIDEGQERCFSETTYVQFDNLVELTREQLASITSGFLQHMDPERLRALLNCAKRSDDIPGSAIAAIEATISSIVAAHHADVKARRDRKAAAKAPMGRKSVAVHGVVAVREWYMESCQSCRIEFCDVTQVSDGELKSVFSGWKQPPPTFLADAELAFQMAAEASGDRCQCSNKSR